MTFENERQALLDAIRNEFGVTLLWYKNLVHSGYREDVSIHGFFSAPHEIPTPETKQNIRRWIENRGWQYSRQMVKSEANPDRRIEYIYLAPMLLVKLEQGYHATRFASLRSIQAEGLLPSVPDRQTTERSDCEGNIYICETLGTPADAGVAGRKTAHWWHDHLAQKNRFNDPNWVILEVAIAKVNSARPHRDIWSESGIIVGGVNAIPPEVIKVVYQPGQAEP